MKKFLVLSLFLLPLNLVFADWSNTFLMGRCQNNIQQVYYQNQGNNSNENGWFNVINLNCTNQNQFPATCSNNKVSVTFNNNNYNVDGAVCSSSQYNKYPQAVIVN